MIGPARPMVAARPVTVQSRYVRSALRGRGAVAVGHSAGGKGALSTSIGALLGACRRRRLQDAPAAVDEVTGLHPRHEGLDRHRVNPRARRSETRPGTASTVVATLSCMRTMAPDVVFATTWLRIWLDVPPSHSRGSTDQRIRGFPGSRVLLSHSRTADGAVCCLRPRLPPARRHSVAPRTAARTG
jgi:hypothetical protein